MELPAGTLLDGRYIVEAPLGRGGFATVYAARHALLDTAHAIKILHATPGAEARERLLREGRIQARLAHRHVVRVTDVVEHGGGVALVMDRVYGETLRSRLDQGPLSLEVAVAMGAGILEAVDAAHRADLVHRDLKPENVLIGADGAPLVTDFGIAYAAGGAGRGAPDPAAGAVGTPGYMAPEAYLEAADVDARADIFALGAVLYELLSGQRAFPSQGSWREQYQRASRAAYVPLHQRDPSLPLHLVRAVHAALAPHRSARPPTVADLAERWRGAAPARDASSDAETLNLDLSTAETQIKGASD